MKCPNCNMEIHEKTIRCPRCNALVVQMKKCKNCRKCNFFNKKNCISGSK